METFDHLHAVFRNAKLSIDQVVGSSRCGFRRVRIDKHRRQQRRYQQHRRVALRILAEKPDDAEAIRQAHAQIDQQWRRTPKWVVRAARADAREGKREESLAKLIKAARAKLTEAGHIDSLMGAVQ